MFRSFEITPIRKLGEGRTLEGVGLEWTEEASFRRVMLPTFIIAFVMFVIMTVTGLYALYLNTILGLLIAGFGGYMMIRCIWWVIGPLPRRAIIFMRDGDIAVPHGIPRTKGGSWLKLDQASLANIEAGPGWAGIPNDWTTTVALVSTVGSTVTISTKLHREEAREIIVGLALALKQMRASVAEHQTVARAPATRQSTLIE